MQLRKTAFQIGPHFTVGENVRSECPMSMGKAVPRLGEVLAGQGSSLTEHQYPTGAKHQHWDGLGSGPCTKQKLVPAFIPMQPGSGPAQHPSVAPHCS